MEYNLRPQWRQWTYITCQNPTCGRCGLNHAIDMCYAVRRQCFKCKNYGHYGRMCKTIAKPPGSTETKIKKNGKSSGQKQRDSLRMSIYIERKNIMRELPFASLRTTSFLDTVLNNNVLTDHLCSAKRNISKLNETSESKIRKMEENLQQVIEKMEYFQKRESECLEKIEQSKLLNENMKRQLQSAEQKISTFERQNKELSERLRINSEQKIQTQHADKLSAENEDLRKQLKDKDKYCEFLKKCCIEMEADYKLKLDEEKELTEIQKRLREESEQKAMKQFLDLQASVQNDLATLRQHRMNQNGPPGNPNEACTFPSNQCYFSPTNPFRNHQQSSRNYRGRGRF